MHAREPKTGHKNSDLSKSTYLNYMKIIITQCQYPPHPLDFSILPAFISGTERHFPRSRPFYTSNVKATLFAEHSMMKLQRQLHWQFRRERGLLPRLPALRLLQSFSLFFGITNPHSSSETANRRSIAQATVTVSRVWNGKGNCSKAYLLRPYVLHMLDDTCVTLAHVWSDIGKGGQLSHRYLTCVPGLRQFGEQLTSDPIKSAIYTPKTSSVTVPRTLGLLHRSGIGLCCVSIRMYDGVAPANRVDDRGRHSIVGDAALKQEERQEL